MKRKQKKIMAWMLSAALVLTVPFSVLAAQGDGIDGASAKESIPAQTKEDVSREDIRREEASNGDARSKPDVFQVVLPANVDHVFDFIMDPQKLIDKTDAQAYDGSRFEEDATLFFKRSDEDSDEEYSSVSDALTIINKGSVHVDVRLTASISPDSVKGIRLSDDPKFKDSTDASLYLALTDGENIVPICSEEGAVIEATISGISEEDEEYNEYSFQLTGAVNMNGDWSELTDIVPEVTVTWEVSAGNGELEEEETEEEIEKEEEIKIPEGLETDAATEESKAAEEDSIAAEESKAAEEDSIAAEESKAAEEDSIAAEESKTAEEEPGADGGNSAADGDGSASDETSASQETSGMLNTDNPSSEGNNSGGITAENGSPNSGSTTTEDGINNSGNAVVGDETNHPGDTGQEDGSNSSDNTAADNGSADKNNNEGEITGGSSVEEIPSNGGTSESETENNSSTAGSCADGDGNGAVPGENNQTAENTGSEDNKISEDAADKTSDERSTKTNTVSAENSAATDRTAGKNSAERHEYSGEAHLSDGKESVKNEESEEKRESAEERESAE